MSSPRNQSAVQPFRDETTSGFAVMLVIITVVLWSVNAFFATRLKHVPTLLLTGMALCIGGSLSAFQWRSWRIPLTTWMIGVVGIFGYHYLFFSAFRYAPAVEVNLINYLWPLLVVLLSPLVFPGCNLRWQHKLGAAMGFAGATLIATNGDIRIQSRNGKGYLLAGAAALVWALYSLFTKRVPLFPSTAVSGFCLVSGVLSLGVYFTMSPGWPIDGFPDSSDWVFVLLMGIGPLGAAFLTWDAALKRGDSRIIGCLANLTPLTSTLVLVILGSQALNCTSALGMILLVAGMLIGSLEMFRNQQPQSKNNSPSQG